METLSQPPTYRVIKGDSPESEIVSTVLGSGDHALVLPPRFLSEELDIESPEHYQSVNIGLLSSGSTGHPRCIWNTLGNLKENASITSQVLNVDQTSRVLILAGPWHVAGLSWALMAEQVNAEYIIKAPAVGETESWLRLINDFSPTHLLTVPNILRNLSEHENWYVPEIVFGGDHLNDDSYEIIRKRSDALTHAYGQTEAGGLLASVRFSNEEQLLPSQKICVGTAAPSMYLSCIGSPGAPAEVKAWSPTSVYNGYYQTGDLGYLDDEHRLLITGRSGKAKGNCNMLTSVTSIMHK